MDIFYDFSSVVSPIYYIALFFLMTITAFLLGLVRFIGPVAFASLYFYGALLIMMHDGIEGLLHGLLLAPTFLCFLYLGAVSKPIRITLRSSRSTDFTLFFLLFSVACCFAYLLLLFYIAKSYSLSFPKVDKLAWALGAGLAPYVYSLFSGVLMTCAFLLFFKKKYIVFSFAAFSLVVGGYVMGEKVALVNLLFLVVVCLLSQREGVRFWIYFSGFSLISMALTVLVFFGGLDGDLAAAVDAFLIRVVATFDGTIIIVMLGLSDTLELPHSFLYYAFQFFTSRIDGVEPGLGQILAGFEVYPYPENGGPNDSLVNYYMLGGFFDKAFVFLFVASFAFLLGMIDNIIKSGRFAQYPFAWSFVLVPLYFMLPAFFQATGTAFLLIAKYYVFLLPAIALIFSMRRLVNVK
ncbi:hypothetical protein [Stutzerimonas kunmingensis]|uniref:hypothetical protein n=1 Tax=Stutzerimonas kunmingensis TaxID=1211807 RepID=UPI002897D9F2|nr:hypothetical protein [Stutzerimonas kunmingensis]